MKQPRKAEKAPAPLNSDKIKPENWDDDVDGTDYIEEHQFHNYDQLSYLFENNSIDY